MTKLPSEIMSPFIMLIEDLYTAPEAQRDLLIKELFEKGQQCYEEMKSLDNDFMDLRKKNIELEEKIQSLYENLDKQRASMDPRDFEYHKERCKDKYDEVWSQLDSDSQEFLVTAHYILYKIRSQKRDFSPVIIEFCRVFENELQKKIFDGYMKSLMEKEPPIIDNDSAYNKINIALSDNRKKGCYFLSSSDMIKCLGTLRHISPSRSGYNHDMRSYLSTRNWDISALSNIDFEKSVQRYIDKYRNEAAHPNMMDEVVANRCADKTRTVVRWFLSSKRHV